MRISVLRPPQSSGHTAAVPFFALCARIAMAALEQSAATPVHHASGNWTENEVRELIRLWPTHSITDISSIMRRGMNAVSIKASRLGLPSKVQLRMGRQSESINPKARVRPCLSCQTPFFSQGAHNRVCDKCKDSAAWRGATASGHVVWTGGRK